VCFSDSLTDFYDLCWHTIKELEQKQLKKKYYRVQTTHVKAIGIDEIHTVDEAKKWSE